MIARAGMTVVDDRMVTKIAKKGDQVVSEANILVSADGTIKTDVQTLASGFSRIRYRSAQRELGDSCQGSKALRRKSAALTQAVVDRLHRSPNPEVALAQSMRAFHLCWRR